MLDDGTDNMYACHRHNCSAMTNNGNTKKHRGLGFRKHSYDPELIKEDFKKPVKDRSFVGALRDERSRFIADGYSHFVHTGRLIANLFSENNVNAIRRAREGDGDEDTQSTCDTMGDSIGAAWSNIIRGYGDPKDDAFTVSDLMVCLVWYYILLL